MKWYISIEKAKEIVRWLQAHSPKNFAMFLEFNNRSIDLEYIIDDMSKMYQQSPDQYTDAWEVITIIKWILKKYENT